MLKFIFTKIALVISKLLRYATNASPNADEFETTAKAENTAILDEAVIGKMILGNEG